MRLYDIDDVNKTGPFIEHPDPMSRLASDPVERMRQVATLRRARLCTKAEARRLLEAT